MESIACTVLVLGGGPGGYVCAMRAGQLGLDTVLVEAGRLGGTCLNVGCIPSKSLIHAADQFHIAKRFAASASLGVRVADPTIDLATTMAWKDGIVSRLGGGVFGLLRRAKVKVVTGVGSLRDGKTCVVESDTGRQVITAEHVVIATGSEAVPLPALPFGGPAVSSTEALAFDSVPGHLLVIGGGYIGLELGIAYRKLGAEVTVIEATERLLPQYDAELTRPVMSRMQKLGIKVHLKARALGLDPTGAALKVELDDGHEHRLPADRFLVTVGRRARLTGFGLEELDLTMNGAAIEIDDQCRTSMRNVWAVGDVTGEPMLEHRAVAQGEMVAEIIAGRKRSFDKVAIAAVCFTDPEIVAAGLSPDAARSTGHPVKVGSFPLTANGRAMTLQAEDGFVRVVARSDNHVVLGIQAVGQGVSELSAGFALALEMGARLEDIAATIHVHPTLSECLREAALTALGHGLHA
jgi:dihydrolipoamide dehydrogenase